MFEIVVEALLNNEQKAPISHHDKNLILGFFHATVNFVCR